MYFYFALLGIAALLSVLMSFLTGSGTIRVRRKTHKMIGVVSLALASVHGVYMIYQNFFY